MPRPAGGGKGGGNGDTGTVFAVLGPTSDGTGLFGTGDPSRAITITATDPATGTTWVGTTATWYEQDGTWYWSIDYGSLNNTQYGSDTFDDESGDFTVVASYEDVNPKNGRTKTVSTEPYNLSIEGVDTEAPTASAPVLLLESDSGFPGDGITNDTLATFRIAFDPTVRAGDTVDLVVNGSVDVTRVLTQADIDQGFVDLTTTGSTLVEGSNAVLARLSDNAGNQSDTSSTDIVLDTTPPAATIDTVLASDGSADPDVLVSDGTPVLTGQAEAGATVSLREADGTLLGSTVSTDGRWTIESTALSDGAHLLHVIVTDVAGNSSQSDDFQLTIDTTVEFAEISGIEEDTGIVGDGVTSDDTPILQGIAEPGATVMVYAVVDGAPDLTSSVTATVQTDGSWTADPGILAEGTHVFRALVRDTAGNEAWTSDLVVEIDTVVTDAVIVETLVDSGSVPDSLAIANGGSTSDSSPMLRGTSERLSRIEVFVDGVYAGETTADASGQWSYSLSGLAEGTRAISLRTTDLAGNVSGDPTGPSDFTIVVEPAPEPDIDPLYAEQWNLGMLGGLETVWQDYTGDGVVVAIYDDGIAYGHVDLDGNYDASRHLVWNGSVLDPLPVAEEEARHGTAVAGIIASEKNGEGTIGIAYDATIVGVNIFSGPASINNTTDLSGFEYAIAEMDEFDVVNHSWGAAPVYLNDTVASTLAYLAAVEEAVTIGRDGLGTIVLKAAGNWADSSQGDANDATRFSITVGAYDSDGDVSWYSNRGANILISAPSSGLTVADEEGNLLPESNLRIPTTDRDGSYGYADGSWSSAYATSGFGGTSAATPTAAGVVALMLEANPDLGWRDVQNILAQSAVWTGSEIGVLNTATELVPTDLDIDGVFESLVETPVEFFAGTWNGSQTWNGGAMHFSEDYGFGALNAHGAVRMAEVWGLFGSPQTSENEAHFSTGTMAPDGLSVSGAGDTANWTFDYSGPAMDLEYVDIAIQLSTTLMQEVSLSLTSPDGTTVSLLDLPINDYTPAYDFLGLILLSVDVTWNFGANAFRGEDPNGTWTVTLEENDVSFDIDNYGTEYDGNAIDAISLDFYGSSGSVVLDDVYTYTDEMLSTGLAAEMGRVVIDDAAGTDWLNLAAMTADVDLDLALGMTADDGSGPVQIASFATGTSIENAVSGDGNDILRGDDGNNVLVGMRGNDTLEGGAGNDEISGHFGSDVLSGGLGADIFHFDLGYGDDVVLDFNQSEADVVWLFGFTETSFDQLSFGVVGNDQVLSFASGDSLTFADAADHTFAADDFWFGDQILA
ncbi:Ig-like domain-containing protein [Defluviimonas sp. D31]|nr:Ig-like domain-containing protein [Defluviimonas sp. D31]